MNEVRKNMSLFRKKERKDETNKQQKETNKSVRKTISGQNAWIFRGILISFVFSAVFSCFYGVFRKQAEKEVVNPVAQAENIDDDIGFEMELVKQVEVNIDYILMLVSKYHQSNCTDKEILGSIDKAIKSSLALRSKKDLIDNFIERINANTDVMNDWTKFVREQKEQDLKALIEDENLNEEETRKFIDNSFRDGQVKTTGTDIEKILPPMRRFGGGNRNERKQTIIEKVLKFFEKYFGLSI